MHYCKLCNRFFLNQQDGQWLAPSQISSSESCKYHVEAFDNTVLLWQTKEFFYQRLLLTATSVTEPVGHIICVGDKNQFHQYNLFYLRRSLST